MFSDTDFGVEMLNTALCLTFFFVFTIFIKEFFFMKNLTFGYLLSLFMIGSAVFLSQSLIQRTIWSAGDDSRTVNIAGRQRMLSQKISKSVLIMKSADSEEEFLKSQKELKESAMLWLKSHEALQNGHTEMQLSHVNNSEPILGLFEKMKSSYTQMKEGISKVTALEFSNPDKDTAVELSLIKILESEDNYLELMNEITFAYDNEAKSRIKGLSKSSFVLFVLIITLLVLVGLFIFRPAITKINDYTKRLILKESSLQVALKESNVQKEKVDYLNQQAKIVFENVNQGIFLLDKENVISEMHSRALSEILMVEEVEGKSFIELLKAKLMQRDIDALEIFAKHLYNSDIEEDVLSQLNPISEVEIFFNKDAGVESKHLKVSFLRIYDGDEVRNVLVNITNETEAIKLQKQVQLIEEKNKKDSEQLLSILRVDTESLKIFLMNTKETLVDISRQYESYKDKDFKKLVDLTFIVIHRLKGNAQMIDLEIMTERLHVLEDVITELKSKENIVGGDFLKILFEINEIDFMVDNMEQMILKISEVKEAVSSELDGDQEPESDIIPPLRRGLAKLCGETSKAIDLHYTDNGTLVPKEYKEHFNDMLVQLIRNTVAHGVEDAAERIEAGKTKVATITIKWNIANHEHIVLSYQDDGRGLDFSKIIIKALEKKLISKEEVKGMTTEKAIALLFMSDMSTSDTIDQYSGRGQGLGLIKSITEKYHGNYKVFSKKGHGFKINITLPLVNELITEAQIYD